MGKMILYKKKILFIRNVSHNFCPTSISRTFQLSRRDATPSAFKRMRKSKNFKIINRLTRMRLSSLLEIFFRACVTCFALANVKAISLEGMESDLIITWYHIVSGQKWAQ